MKNFGLIMVTAIAVLGTGCAHKEVFKPEHVKGEWRNAGRLTAPIAQTSQTSAILENGKLVVKE